MKESKRRFVCFSSKVHLLKVKISELSIAILPYIGLFVIVILLIIFIPGLSTFLPNPIFGS